MGPPSPVNTHGAIRRAPTFASENVPCRKVMTVTAQRWRWSDRVGNAGTKTSVNPSVIIVGHPVRQLLRAAGWNGSTPLKGLSGDQGVTAAQHAWISGGRNSRTTLRTDSREHQCDFILFCQASDWLSATGVSTPPCPVDSKKFRLSITLDTLARADGSLRTLLPRLSCIDVLVVDDWAMATRLAETERRDFWESCEDCYQTRSTILTSQLPVAHRHEQIGDPTAAATGRCRCAGKSNGFT